MYVYEVKDLVYKRFEHIEDKVENHYWKKYGLYEEQA